MDMEKGRFCITAIVSIIIIILTLQTTYLYSKLHRSRTARAFLLLQGSFILWAVLRLAEAYAPTKELVKGNMLCQHVLIAIIVMTLYYLLLSADTKILGKCQLCLTAAILTILLLTALMGGKNVLYDMVPIIPSELLCLMLSYGEKRPSVTGKLSFKTVIRSIGDGILVLDTKQRIMDVNYSFFEPIFSMEKPGSYMEFCRHLTDAGAIADKDYHTLTEMPVSAGEYEIDFLINKEYLTCICKSTTLSNSKDNSIGTMISFHDISGYRKLVIELEDKKLELTQIQDKLRDYLQVVDRLETAKEKREIFMKIQKSIGQEIMELLTMLEVIQIKADRVSPQEIELAIESCRSMIERIRESVSEIERY